MDEDREELSRLDGDKLVQMPYSLAMVGIDGTGRQWGNRFEPGGPPYNDILCYKDGKLLQTIELAQLADVNAGGVGAGISIKLQLHAVYPAIFADGKTRLLPIPEAALGRVESINDKGEAVGYYWRDTLAEAPSVAYFWDGQKIVPLTPPKPGAAYYPEQINNRGDIAAVWRMDDRSRVYLTLGRDR